MRIDLLPLEYRPQPPLSTFRLAVYILGVLLVLGLASGLVYLYFNHLTMAQQLQSTQEQLQMFQGSISAVKQAEQLNREVVEQKAQLEQIKQAYPDLRRILSGLARAVPENCWFTNLSIGSDGGMKLTGNTVSLSILGDLMFHINQLDSVQALKLNSVQQQTENSAALSIYAFNIEMNTGRSSQYVENRQN
ncbi:Tfp pilus assembly protein PilN [Hydrogenispora ethanolica]|uniref:Tfp pilus assembly protein PilN n=1 Tax=Hydrogenispora ethanolica TaxID=1082276 RepID=A0A4R1RNK8_HYDET|nr:PilN domain-containing protein [Hydrogenispora ethanolica]TCL67432.1 Tfp pilus assembly protein PilN [Hydrogenispora ethanolica]